MSATPDTFESLYPSGNTRALATHTLSSSPTASIGPPPGLSPTSSLDQYRNNNFLFDFDSINLGGNITGNGNNLFRSIPSLDEELIGVRPHQIQKPIAPPSAITIENQSGKEYYKSKSGLKI